jgi:hypothetical protein
MNATTTEINLPNGKIVKLKPYDMKICPINLQLKACEIEFSDIEIFARLQNENEETVFLLADENANIYIKDFEILSGKRKNYDNFNLIKDGKKTQFVFLNKELSNKTWLLNDKIIFNADYVLSNGVIAVEKNTEVAYYDLENKFSSRTCLVSEFWDFVKVKTLDISKVEYCAPEIALNYDYSNWKRVGENTDSLSCDLYNEFVWYKTKIPNNLTELTLSARHLFAVYVNGKEILNRNSYKIEKLQDVPETICIPLCERILTQEVNELTILVQNLGFDKGFSGDTNNPRGLVTCETTPRIPLEFSVCEKLSLERRDWRESENPYLAKITAHFDIDFKENEFFAKYISFEDFKCRRATIFLNGIKIGRYIKRTHVQDKFYLINEFLKPHNTLEIVVWAKERNTKSLWGFKFDLKNVKIKLGTFKKYQLFK